MSNGKDKIIPQNSRKLRPRQKKEERFLIKKGQSQIKMGPKCTYSCPYCVENFSSLRILETHIGCFHRQRRRPRKQSNEVQPDDKKYDKADERILEKRMVIILFYFS